jgi:hypothetical protein
VEGQEDQLYMLKDSWQERCRDPEALFYLLIENHTDDVQWKGIARCKGTIDLSETDTSHVTCSATLQGFLNDNRIHMQMLMSPVGCRLSEF